MVQICTVYSIVPFPSCDREGGTARGSRPIGDVWCSAGPSIAGLGLRNGIVLICHLQNRYMERRKPSSSTRGFKRL